MGIRLRLAMQFAETSPRAPQMIASAPSRPKIPAYPETLDGSFVLVTPADVSSTPGSPQTPVTCTRESIARWAALRETPSYVQKRARQTPASLGSSAPMTTLRQFAVEIEAAKQNSIDRCENDTVENKKPAVRERQPLRNMNETTDEGIENLLCPGIAALVALGGLIYLGSSSSKSTIHSFD